MKHGDPLLLAWQTTITRKRDDAAVFDATGRIARSFRDIDSRARAFEAQMDRLLPGTVVAVQVGNHEDWPAVFIACLRKQLVVLPLDQSIGEQQRDAALEICKASALVSAGASAKEEVEQLEAALDAARKALAAAESAAAKAVDAQERSAAALSDAQAKAEATAAALEEADAELEALGVARVSYGSAFSRAAITAVKRLAEALLSKGDPRPLLRDSLPRAEYQALLRGRS